MTSQSPFTNMDQLKSQHDTYTINPQREGTELSWFTHVCWCPGSLRRQDISTHDTDYVE